MIYKIRLFGRKIEITTEDIMIIIGIFLGLAVLVYGILVDIYAPWFFNYILYAILVAIIPYFAYKYYKAMIISNKEENFPRFLRDLSDSLLSGQPLPVAIRTALESDYGHLNKDIKKLHIEISWGVPFEKALENMKKRIESKLIGRAIDIVIQAHKSGGDIAKTINTVADDIKKTKLLEEERKSKTKKFVIVVYAIFLLYLVIVLMLTNQIVPQLPIISAIQQYIGGSGTNLTEIEFRNLIFHLTLIEAIANGIMCGIIAEGSFEASIRHIVLLVGASVLAFALFAPTPDPLERIANIIMQVPLADDAQVPLGEYYVTKNLKAIKIKEILYKLSKSENSKKFNEKDLQEMSITFDADPGCGPCKEGWVIVQKNEVILNRPCVIDITLVKRKYGYTILIK